MFFIGLNGKVSKEPEIYLPSGVRIWSSALVVTGAIKGKFLPQEHLSGKIFHISHVSYLIRGILKFSKPVQTKRPSVPGATGSSCSLST